MHGYMMPGGAPKNNSPIVITWLHYAPSPDADLPAKPSNSRLSSISHQEIGAELPARIAGRRLRGHLKISSTLQRLATAGWRLASLAGCVRAINCLNVFPWCRLTRTIPQGWQSSRVPKNSNEEGKPLKELLRL